MNTGVISMGIKCPIIREGDNLANIVTDAVLNTTAVYDNGYDFSNDEPFYYDINDKDIIGITESIIARAAGEYITVNDIAADIEKKFGKDAVINIICPIYSRNRFSMILKGIARAASKIVFTMPLYDEVGNPSRVNPFTGINIQEYYKEICENENCEAVFLNGFPEDIPNELYCGLHDYVGWKETHVPPTRITDDNTCYTLADICSDVSPDWGLLGTNKSTEEKLKLFPSKKAAQKVCDEVKAQIKKVTGKDVIVCSYGDGCFKDPVGGIWEFADPVSMPAYTDADIIESTPNEIKIKAFADDQFKDLSGDELAEAVKTTIKKKDNNLVGKMASQGTTPRLYRDLLASLMDLTSGSGDKGTPVILIKNYFKNYTSE